MLSQVSGEGEADGSLDFSGADGAAFVGASDGGGLSGDGVEHIEGEGVQDLDSLGGECELASGGLVDTGNVSGEAALVLARTLDALLSTTLSTSRFSTLSHFCFVFGVVEVEKNLFVLISDDEEELKKKSTFS